MGASVCFPPVDCMHLSPKMDLGEVGGWADLPL